MFKEQWAIPDLDGSICCPKIFSCPPLPTKIKCVIILHRIWRFRYKNGNLAFLFVLPPPPHFLLVPLPLTKKWCWCCHKQKGTSFFSYCSILRHTTHADCTYLYAVTLFQDCISNKTVCIVSCHRTPPSSLRLMSCWMKQFFCMYSIYFVSGYNCATLQN